MYKGQTACTYGIPKFYDGGDLKATLSNNVGFLGRQVQIAIR